MQERVRRHQESRGNNEWSLVEAPVQVAQALTDSAGYNVRLVDCLTLWVSNLMMQADSTGRDLTEETIAEECQKVMAAAKELSGAVLFVTNEVGLGIVPENRLARLFRDLVGRCNRIIAEAADEVVLVTCGIPIQVKGNG
jgi:adenosylcobinamide kinase/adenosylcobinamide-phosphate guanylyltransferase